MVDSDGREALFALRVAISRFTGTFYLTIAEYCVERNFLAWHFRALASRRVPFSSKDLSRAQQKFARSRKRERVCTKIQINVPRGNTDMTKSETVH